MTYVDQQSHFFTIPVSTTNFDSLNLYRRMIADRLPELVSAKLNPSTFNTIFSTTPLNRLLLSVSRKPAADCSLRRPRTTVESADGAAPPDCGTREVSGCDSVV
jgi:hypothetical protein